MLRTSVVSERLQISKLYRADTIGSLSEIYWQRLTLDVLWTSKLLSGCTVARVGWPVVHKFTTDQNPLRRIPGPQRDTQRRSNCSRFWSAQWLALWVQIIYHRPHCGPWAAMKYCRVCLSAASLLNSNKNQISPRRRLGRYSVHHVCMLLWKYATFKVTNPREARSSIKTCFLHYFRGVKFWACCRNVRYIVPCRGWFFSRKIRVSELLQTRRWWMHYKQRHFIILRWLHGKTRVSQARILTSSRWEMSGDVLFTIFSLVADRRKILVKSK